MLIEQKFTQYSVSYFAASSYKTNLLSVTQLLGFEKIPWGIAPPMLGLSLSVGILVSIIGFIILRKKNMLFIYSLIGFGVSIFLASNLSTILWNSIDFLKLLQFPWRFLAGATVTGVFAISLFLNQLKTRLKIFIFLD